MKPQQVARPRHLDHLSDDERGYPVISTVGRGAHGASFGSINERRKVALATFDWCSVCGLPFGGAARWQVILGERPVPADREAEVLFGEAPAHEICLVYAAHVCPHLSSPWHRIDDEYRAGQRREDKIRLAGFARTSSVDALRSGLQNDIHVLHFAQSGLTDELSYSRPDELAERYSALLATEQIPVLSPADTGLIGLFNEHSDMGDTVCGAALMAGASFAKDIQNVQGIEEFAASGYWRPLALQLLDPDKLADFGQDIDDPASRLMARWLAERQGDLPEVLAAWRKAGQRLAISRRSPRATPSYASVGRTAAKNVPCPCGSGRQARRCHPGSQRAAYAPSGTPSAAGIPSPSSAGSPLPDAPWQG